MYVCSEKYTFLLKVLRSKRLIQIHARHDFLKD